MTPLRSHSIIPGPTAVTTPERSHQPVDPGGFSVSDPTSSSRTKPIPRAPHPFAGPSPPNVSQGIVQSLPVARARPDPYLMVAIDRSVQATCSPRQAKWVHRMPPRSGPPPNRRFSTACTMQARGGPREHGQRGLTIPIAKWSNDERRVRVEELDPRKRRRRANDCAGTAESSPVRGTQDSQHPAGGQCVGPAYSPPRSHVPSVLPARSSAILVLRPRSHEPLSGAVLIARQKEVRTSLRGVAYHLAAHVIPEPPAFTPIR
ncbi:hypothetical protein C8Q72DRAFT_943807, partial [Fomitopsis betulina]